jgi:hypothetical protein
MVELVNPKPLENPKMSMPTRESARVFENAMIRLPNIVMPKPMSSALFNPSLFRYMPTNIFDSTVPTRENSGINEEMPTDILYPDWKSFNAGATEFITKEYENIMSMGKRFDIFILSSFFVFSVFSVFIFSMSVYP